MQRDLDRKPSVRKRPNIKDIAKAAGLSTAAVSYALSGKGRVSAQTQETVKKIADEIGFMRDDTATRLRTGQSNLLAAIVHDISNPWMASVRRPRIPE
ncbi:LacI family DNA-binding transcriptional regulator [Mesorhizobium sp. M0814]|uniref:LacI family DNA-binding transcriptional regulator n=1 Tax=Mesorhizobium sp. M0814 TaxID=2957004 RepID=UPI0033378BC8